ncbi:MAG: pyridoxamine 5'-phosphate oxidase [Chitinophagales bacterium]
MNLHELRENYSKYSLNETEVNTNPFKQFEVWFGDAKNGAIREPNAMTLATATHSGKPSARVVLLKEVNQEGFVFYTNYLSRKGKEIGENPYATILFFWDALERQVRIEGILKKVDEATSEAYFNSRPLESRIGAIVSAQSTVIESAQVLETLFEQTKAAGNIVRPKHWGGYVLMPDYFEFWQGRPDRIHDRIAYTQTKSEWLIQRLAP